jgi:hypothetical protein
MRSYGIDSQWRGDLYPISYEAITKLMQAVFQLKTQRIVFGRLRHPTGINPLATKAHATGLQTIKSEPKETV